MPIHRVCLASLALVVALSSCKVSQPPAKPRSSLCGSEVTLPFSLSVDETTVEVSQGLEDGARTVVQRVTHRGDFVQEVVIIPGTPAANERPITIRGRYAREYFDGVSSWELRTQDGVTWDGEVDGKRVMPFTSASAATLDDGSPFPTVVALVPEVMANTDAALAQLGVGGGSCNATATQRSALYAGGAGQGDDGRPNCVSCNHTCDVAFWGILATGSVVCGLMSLCPPCAAICIGFVVADAFIALKVCSDLCESTACNGPPCGGSNRCEVGGACAAPSLEDRKAWCCKAGTTPCGHVPGGLIPYPCCGGGETCAWAESKCCAPPLKAIDGKCCPPENQWKTPSGGDVCCSHAPCADGSCCELGSCVAGTCCAVPCGGSCCGGAGDACVAGRCCAPEQQCGSTCCGGGTVCLDKATGRCGLAPSVTCPPGTVVKFDQATPGAFLCCAPEQAGCNGACCALGSMCCAAGGTTMSCRTDCIR